VLVIDDDAMLLVSTVRLLAQEGHEVRGEASPEAGIELVRTFRPNVLLLDYFMGKLNGADVVRAIRAFDTLTQVILVTGYASEKPARQMLAELDIQGYHDKTDGPQRLLVLVDAALKHHDVLMRMEGQRRALRHILDVSAELFRLGPVEHLFSTAIEHVGALLEAGDGFVATENSGFFVLSAAAEGVGIRAGTGAYRAARRFSDLGEAATSAAVAGLAAKLPVVHEAGYILIPLETREGDRGCMVLEGRSLSPDAIEPCRIYAQQIMQAFENLLLYRQATVDPLTELCNRSFGLRRLEEILALGSRNRHRTGVLMIDVDHFKLVNDTHGHAAGDLVLRSLARAVARACRSTDVVSRHGGEELLVTLPSTGAEGAAVIAEAVRAAVEALRVVFEGRPIPVTISIGVASCGPGQLELDDLLRRADEALYQAKDAGRNRVCLHQPAVVAERGAA
jgi:diguanylate cyclase (GGDEF)-like protein